MEGEEIEKKYLVHKIGKFEIEREKIISLFMYIHYIFVCNK